MKNLLTGPTILIPKHSKKIPASKQTSEFQRDKRVKKSCKRKGMTWGHLTLSMECFPSHFPFLVFQDVVEQDQFSLRSLTGHIEGGILIFFHNWKFLMVSSSSLLGKTLRVCFRSSLPGGSVPRKQLLSYLCSQVCVWVHMMCVCLCLCVICMSGWIWENAVQLEPPRYFPHPLCTQE